MKIETASLLDYFDAPEGYLGLFGWVCGYSADAVFMDQAAERFSRLTHAQRAYQGETVLALILDPGSPAITPVEAPAVAHVALRAQSVRPFALMHAKVALLGFRHERSGGDWRIRLVVSTGNWTRQTLEDSLDLAWCIEVAGSDLSDVNEEVRRNCADVNVAADLFAFLRLHFDTGILDLDVGPQSATSGSRVSQLTAWVEACVGAAAGQAARLFDNRSEPLLSQLTNRIEDQGGVVARNYLAMGSGFYESAQGRDGRIGVPHVLERIVAELQGAKHLTGAPEVDIFVNPDGCQAVAVSLEAIQKKEYSVLAAGQPAILFGEDSRRTLHAKFLFSANWRSNSNACNSSWVYLGSGNLTGPGFLHQMHPQLGNLEAGVVFSPKGLVWECGRDVNPESVVTNVLPIQWSEVITNVESLSEGGDMPERQDAFLAGPVSWLRWESNAEGGALVAEIEVAGFDVLDRNGQRCPKAAHGFYWNDERPRQVFIQWSLDGEPRLNVVAVIDGFGRIAATELPALDMEEAWWQLASFPALPDDDELELRGMNDCPGEASRGTSAGADHRYPIRQMMELVEHIAATQTRISVLDWITWCQRLEQTLVQLKGNATIDYFRSMGLNPLSPLQQEPFRPDFAIDESTAEGARYEALLKRVELEWQVSRLSPIGVEL